MSPAKNFIKSFRDHPQSVDETYLQHLAFALLFAGRLIGAGLAALVHAFIPALFQTTASRSICTMHTKITSRNTVHNQRAPTTGSVEGGVS